MGSITNIFNFLITYVNARLNAILNCARKCHMFLFLERSLGSSFNIFLIRYIIFDRIGVILLLEDTYENRESYNDFSIIILIIFSLII